MEKNLIKKTAKGAKQTFHQRIHTNGEQAHGESIEHH